MKHEELVHSLKSLHLTAISRDYANLARQCEEARRTYEQYLAALTQTEITHRKRVKVNRLIREAKFPILKTLDAYDYTHIKGVTLMALG
jgi:DNA replication protein DnaC